jgi:hypothetical protein
MKIALASLLFLILGLLLPSSAYAEPDCGKPALFFDLGENTLVYTDGRYPKDDPSGDLVDMHYMGGADSYLKDLVRKGYSVNLIVNIPQGWGVQGLIQYLERPANPASGDPGGWTPGAPRFDWKMFGRIFVPLLDDNRKPQHSDLPFAPGELWLYRQAMARLPKGCPALLQTGIKEEVLAAESVGMTAWVHPKTKGRMALIPEREIESFVKRHEREVKDAMEAQRKAEEEYAARGEVIPRRKSADSTE